MADYISEHVTVSYILYQDEAAMKQIGERVAWVAVTYPEMPKYTESGSVVMRVRDYGDIVLPLHAKQNGYLRKELHRTEDELWVYATDMHKLPCKDRTDNALRVDLPGLVREFPVWCMWDDGSYELVS